MPRASGETENMAYSTSHHMLLYCTASATFHYFQAGASRFRTVNVIATTLPTNLAGKLDHSTTLNLLNSGTKLISVAKCLVSAFNCGVILICVAKSFVSAFRRTSLVKSSKYSL
jgi:hypothetical protein